MSCVEFCFKLEIMHGVHAGLTIKKANSLNELICVGWDWKSPKVYLIILIINSVQVNIGIINICKDQEWNN
jgi:hypothetical protein